MATQIIKVETKVTGTQNGQVVFEKDQAASLMPDASGGLQAVDDVVVADGILNMQFHCHGISGTAWTLTITQLAPNPAGLFKKEGMIGSFGHSLVVDAVVI